MYLCHNRLIRGLIRFFDRYADAFEQDVEPIEDDEYGICTGVQYGRAPGREATSMW